MKHIWLILIVLHLAGVNIIGQTTEKGKVSPGQKDSNSLIEQKILQLEKEYFDAKLENDTKFMEVFLVDNFSSTNQFGHVRNKAQSIAFFKGFKPRTFTLDEIKVILENDTAALVEGYQSENGEKFYFSHKLINNKGNWQIISAAQKFPEFQKYVGAGLYKIKGYLRGADGIAVSLMRNVGLQRVSMNAAIVKNGVFTMEGKAIDYPEMTYLITPGKNGQAAFFLENSEISLSGHIDSLANVRVAGSKTQDEYVAYLAKIKPLTEKITGRMDDYQAAAKNKDTVKLQLLNRKFQGVTREILATSKDFINNNPGSFAVPVIFYDIAGKLSTEETDDIIKSLDPGVAKTWLVLTVKEKNEGAKAVSIGKKAPDFTLNDLNGNPISLSSITGAKLLLIDFWAGWCSPCRKENPNLVKTYKRFKDQGFEILGVSLDRTRDEWTKAITADSLTWTQVSDLQFWNSKAVQLYSVSSIPANFLLDKNGVIIAKNLRGEELVKVVKERLRGPDSKKP